MRYRCSTSGIRHSLSTGRRPCSAARIGCRSLAPPGQLRGPPAEAPEPDGRGRVLVIDDATGRSSNNETFDKFYLGGLASATLFEANCACALATSGAHLGPFTRTAGSAEAAALGVADGPGVPAVAMGGAAGRIKNSHPK